MRCYGDPPRSGLVLGFGGSSEPRLDRAVAVLSKALASLPTRSTRATTASLGSTTLRGHGKYHLSLRQDVYFGLQAWTVLKAASSTGEWPYSDCGKWSLLITTNAVTMSSWAAYAAPASIDGTSWACAWWPTCSYVDRQIISLLITPIQADLGVSDTQFGLLHGFAFALFCATMGIPIAYLSDTGSPTCKQRCKRREFQDAEIDRWNEDLC